MRFLRSNKRSTCINGHGVAGVGRGANCTDNPGSRIQGEAKWEVI